MCPTEAEKPTTHHGYFEPQISGIQEIILVVQRLPPPKRDDCPPQNGAWASRP